jgi:hypothetical protein
MVLSSPIRSGDLEANLKNREFPPIPNKVRFRVKFRIRIRVIVGVRVRVRYVVKSTN